MASTGCKFAGCKCDHFVTHKYKQNKCGECFHLASSHEGLSNEQQSLAALASDDSNPCLIDTGLYMGGMQAAMNKKALLQEGITHVVNCAKNIKRVWTKFKEWTKTFTYLSMDMDDDSVCQIREHVYNALPFIDAAIQEGGKVFVHCAQGVSRSGTIVVAYLMAKHQIPFEDALRMAKDGRAIARPNSSFTTQLKAMEADGVFKTILNIPTSATVDVGDGQVVSVVSNAVDSGSAGATASESGSRVEKNVPAADQNSAGLL